MVASVYIEKNVYGGDGLGRLGDGRVVFVPGAFAGERVKAKIIQEKKSFVKASLVEIEEASSERIGDGPVAVPGMVYSNLSVKGECAAKGAQLAEFFERARIAVPEGVCFDKPAEECTEENALNYRNKVVYHFSLAPGSRVLGYRREPEHDIVDVFEDPLACKEINAKLPEIRESVFRLLSTGPKAVRKSVEKKANVTIRWSALSGVVWWLGDAPDSVTLKEVTCGKVFEVPSDGFYQVNPRVGEELVKSVVSKFKSVPTPEVLDLYCGVGVFGLLMPSSRLVGLESGRKAIEFAKLNAAWQGFKDVRFFAGDAARNLVRTRITAETTVVVDPPRGGMERSVALHLARSAAPRIFAVSCDPATLMRDLSILTRTYEVEDVKWFNMFPRTARFEALVVLRKRDSAR